MDLYQHQLTKYDIPLNHLDHEYIRNCKNASELEKIIKILRSKHEGHYPDLEKLAEERLTDLKPKSKMLWKESKLLTASDLNEEERKFIDAEIKEWEENMKSADKDLNSKTSDIRFDNLPPVRGISNTISNEVKKTKTSSKKVNKRVKPRGYDEWDKLDVDAELKKVDDVSPKNDKKKKPSTLGEVDTMGKLEEFIADAALSDQLKSLKAEREKNKGNEAFKAGDFEEALLYYGRSISVLENVPAYNNRAQIYLNNKKWNQALDDCNSVLKLEPTNVKAHLRRAVAYQGLTQYVSSQADLQFVLEKEPTNKQAKSVLKEVEKMLADQKIFGRRMMIEEVEGSDDDDGDDDHDDDDEEVDNADGRDDVSKEGKIASGEELKDDLHGDGSSLAKQVVNDHHLDKTGSGDAVRNGIVDVVPPEKFLGEDQSPSTFSSTALNPPGLPSSEKASSPSPLKASSSPSSEKASSPSLTSILSSPQMVALIAMRNKAEELSRVGQYGEAADVCGEALKLIGDDLQSKEVLGIFESLSICRAESHLKSGKLSACIGDCEAILRFNPRSTEALLRKAMAFEEKENYLEAYVCYRSIPDDDSKSMVARRASDRCAAALKTLHGSDWRSKLPQSPYCLPVGSSASKLDETPAISSALSLQPTLTLSSSSLLPQQSLETKGGIKKESLTQTRSSSPPSSAAATSIDSSSETLSSATSVSSSLPSSNGDGKISVDDLYEQFKATGNNLFAKNEFKEAIQCFTKCIELKGDQVVPYTNRALCYLRLNQYDLVLEDCNQALIIDFHCTKALYRRALAFKMTSEFDKSLIDLETLLKIDPGNSAAKKEINNINNILKQIKEKKFLEACLRKEKRTRQRINITDVEGDSQSSAPKCLKEEKTSQVKNSKKFTMPTIATVTKTTTTKSVKPVPCLTKVTSPYEFMQAYNSAKFAEDLSAYVALFDALEPSSLPKVLSNKLECDMLVVIIRCLKHYLETGKKARAREYLENLMIVERFDMVVMFVSDADRSEIIAMMEKASEQLDQEFVELLRIKFRM